MLLSVLLAVTALGASPAPGTVARIHGRVVAIDARRGTFQIHHDPFALMPMSMTMEVRPVRRADLDALHVGESIDATIDTAIVPWPGTHIRPAATTMRK